MSLKKSNSSISRNMTHRGFGIGYFWCFNI